MTENLGSVEKQMEVGVRWSKFLWQTSDFQATADMADRVVEQAEVSGNLYFVARGHFHSGMALFRLDQFELASKHLDMALDGFRATGDQRQQGGSDSAYPDGCGVVILAEDAYRQVGAQPDRHGALRVREVDTRSGDHPEAFRRLLGRQAAGRCGALRLAHRIGGTCRDGEGR